MSAPTPGFVEVDPQLVRKLQEIVGRSFRVSLGGREADCIPLPHPSGASPWHRMEPGRTLLVRGLDLIAAHPAARS